MNGTLRVISRLERARATDFAKVNQLTCPLS